MTELTLPEIRSIQQSILDDVTEFCEQQYLVYYLSSGTLLGAVRHKGYIPWDDDIDIMLPRRDYELLIKTFPNNNRLKLYSYETVKNFDYPFTKIAETSTVLQENFINKFEIGINIDVFPMDGFPDDERLMQKHIKRIKFFRNLLFLKGVKPREGRSWSKNLISVISKPLLYIISGRSLVNKITQLAIMYDFNSSAKVGMSTWGYGEKEVCPRQLFEEIVKIEFEKKWYNAPKDFKLYLSKLYGNFMELPPLESRTTHHLFRAFKK
ncbi:MAG TPA: LicD family protein [Niabella sp.]|nr:LicD family protein [Niabella sp.]